MVGVDTSSKKVRETFNNKQAEKQGYKVFMEPQIHLELQLPSN